MSFEALHAPQRAAVIARSGLGLGSCSVSDSRFEILRATVWSLAAPSRSAYVSRVIGTAVPTWRLLSDRSTVSEEILRAELREALTTLQDVGDLLEFSGGYWSPATTRLVALPDGSHLLVGGVPTEWLLDGSDVEHHGPFRCLTVVPATVASALPIEEFASWARMPTLPLEAWARDVIDSLERAPYSPSTSEAFEFYMPESCQFGAPQFKRWTESAGSTTATLLARRRRLYGAREFRLVDVRSGRIAGACELHDTDARRLMYAFDLFAKNPIRALAQRVDGRVEWRLTSALPRSEQRMFAALGTSSTPTDRPYEKRWTFVRNEELALDMLRALGIQVAQRPREDGQ